MTVSPFLSVNGWNLGCYGRDRGAVAGRTAEDFDFSDLNMSKETANLSRLLPRETLRRKPANSTHRPNESNSSHSPENNPDASVHTFSAKIRQFCVEISIYKCTY
jgi:hypothetical protein